MQRLRLQVGHAGLGLIQRLLLSRDDDGAVDFNQGVEMYNADDLPIADAMQRGMRSRFAPRGRYSHEEEVLTQFNRWLVSRYEAAERRT